MPSGKFCSFDSRIDREKERERAKISPVNPSFVTSQLKTEPFLKDEKWPHHHCRSLWMAIFEGTDGRAVQRTDTHTHTGNLVTGYWINDDET